MTGRGLLLNELERVSANACRLFALIKPEHLGYRPREGMRSLAELANHLAQIPSVDMRLMRGDEEGAVIALEQQLLRETPDDWAALLKEGTAEMARFIERLTQSDFETGSGTAYYGRTQTHAQWLLEMITHLYHHRAQLFMYLKLNGYPVNTRTLYE
jgi:uncharacterized damage-inducible protein DinB